MRQIVLDTETTGLDPASGHRVIEIGCVEIFNGIPTGRHFHRYLNPERVVPPEVRAVHGLTEEFLADKPLFAEEAGAFLDFIAADPLIAHNAGFDISFVDSELGRLGFPAIAPARVIDTLALARKAFPGAPCSLDALCKRFNIDATHRALHGALLDAQLLAHVYLELTGGRQRDLTMGFAARKPNGAAAPRGARPPRPHAASAGELAAHGEAMAKIRNNLWTGNADAEENPRAGGA